MAPKNPTLLELNKVVEINVKLMECAKIPQNKPSLPHNECSNKLIERTRQLHPQEESSLNEFLAF